MIISIQRTGDQALIYQYDFNAQVLAIQNMKQIRKNISHPEDEYNEILLYTLPDGKVKIEVLCRMIQSGYLSIKLLNYSEWTEVL